MARFGVVHPQVYAILKDYPETRSDDRELILKVYNEFYNVPSSAPFLMVMRDYKLPPFETIRRTRQKLQAENPELRANDEVDAYRRIEEEEYKAYARGES